MNSLSDYDYMLLDIAKALSVSDKYYQRLQIQNQFMCLKECSYYNCKACDYFYMDGKMRLPRCLKEAVKDWALYNTGDDK